MKQVSASVCIAMLTACTSSHVLDESRAKTLIRQAPQTESFQLLVNNFLPAMARSTNADRGPATVTLTRLVEAKLVARKVDVVTYPKISGTWVSQRQSALAGGMAPQSLNMVLQTVGETNGISGYCVYRWGTSPPWAGGDTGQVRGTITPDGSVELTSACYSEGGAQSRYQYSENGTSATLRSLNGGEPGKMESPWILSGTVSGKVEVKWYEYSFAPEVQIIRDNQGVHVASGRYEVGEVANLRLATETQAVANFAWQGQLNQLGSILLDGTLAPGAKPSGNGTAEFAKKPDGTWMLVKVSF